MELVLGDISAAQTGLCEPCEPAKNELLDLVEAMSKEHSKWKWTGGFILQEIVENFK